MPLVDLDSPLTTGLAPDMQDNVALRRIVWLLNQGLGGGGGGGDASAANQVIGNASLSSIDGKVLTNAQLRATPVPVSGTVTVTGAGDASAANQVLQLAQETLIKNQQTDRSQKTQITDGTNDVAVETSATDAIPNTLNRLRIAATIRAFNGTTWDRIRSGITGVVSSFIGYVNTITVGRYSATPIAVPNGSALDLQINQRGSLEVVAPDNVSVNSRAINDRQVGFSLISVGNTAELAVIPGGLYAIATQIPNFISGGTFTVIFEVQDDVALTWSAINVVPKTLPSGNTPISTASAVGLYTVLIPTGINRIRVRLSALSTLTEVRAFVVPVFDGQEVPLPFLGFTGGTFGLASNNPIVPAIEASLFDEIGYHIQNLTGTSQVITPQETQDVTGTNWGNLPGVDTGAITAAAVLPVQTNTAAGKYKVRISARYFRFNLTYTALTAMQFNGITARVASARATPLQQVMTVQGAAVFGGTAAGSGVLLGVQAATAIQTARTGGQIVLQASDKIGRYVTSQEQIRDLVTMSPMVTLTSTTETTIIAAVAAIFNDARAYIITNTSSTGTRVDFRTVTAGSVVFSWYIPPFKSEAVAIPLAMRQATVNTAWSAQLSVAVTDVRITPFSIQVN